MTRGPDPALLDLLLPQTETAVQAARVVLTLAGGLPADAAVHPRIPPAAE